MNKPYQLAHLGVATDYDYTATHKRELASRCGAGRSPASVRARRTASPAATAT
jgi:hypothetical protein